MTQPLILITVFIAALLVTFLIAKFFMRRIEVLRNLRSTRQKRTETDAELDRILGSENEEIRYYIDVVQNQSPNSLAMRMVRAGFFSKRAIIWFNIIRFVMTTGVFISVQAVTDLILESIGIFGSLIAGLVLSGFVFILCSAVLERIGNKRTREFRKLFPDFMDLLLVCLDSGLGIEAAIGRVTREFLVTTRQFGVQLGIINLEIRAGRPLDEALHNFAQRLNLDEARVLAVLFKQSQELGTSVGKALRVYAAELRAMRLVRAEEKANSLPVKMLFPMAVFMFPVNLIIVLVPILLVIMDVMSSMTPN
jgi:tight adherence protein C